MEVCPLLLLSTSDTPESAGLGGKEPETDKKTRLKIDTHKTQARGVRLAFIPKNAVLQCVVI